MNMIGGLFVIDSDENAPLIPKLILVSTLSDHAPGQTRISRQKSVAVL